MRFVLLALLLLSPDAIPARETGFFPVTPSTNEALLLIDGRVEEPPAYTGAPFVPTPPPGASVQFQVFMPEAAFRRAFAISLAFRDSAGTFIDRFEILDARSEMRAPNANRTAPPVALNLDAPRGSKGAQRSVIFISPWTLSSSGLLAVITLQARQPVDVRESLILEARVTVEADTPPERLIQLRGYAPIRWR